ncbi:MAG: hypothetical protein OZ934_05915 [Anaerolineae bacterium]|nr:hypothetical protein [Anaerolineae bacterium]
MTTWSKRAISVSLALVIALGAVGFAAAQGPAQPDYPRAYRVRFVETLMQTVQEVTGLAWSDLLPELRAGQTLTEVLEANGADPQAARDAVRAAVTAEIEAALAEGTLTQARADALLEQLDTALERAFTSAHPLALRDRLRDRLHDRWQQTLETTLIGVIAEMADVEASDLLREALLPPTLGEIAQDYGLDAEAVSAEAQVRITEAINERVADGTLTQEQADELLAALPDWLANRFDAPFWFAQPGMRSGMAAHYSGGFHHRGPGRFDGRGGGMRGW